MFLTEHTMDSTVWEVNTWNGAPTAACHLETGGAGLHLGGMPFRNNACTRWTDAGEAYLSFWSGTDPGRPGGGGVRKRDGSHMDDKEPCAPVVLML